VDEYAFGGELRGVSEWITDPTERDVDYVWMYDNAAGMTVERWFHRAGCRRWLTLRRDTITDVVVA
jgi:heterotetrameric sarcosine oxidase delta subunit